MPIPAAHLRKLEPQVSLPTDQQQRPTEPVQLPPPPQQDESPILKWWRGMTSRGRKWTVAGIVIAALMILGQFGDTTEETKSAKPEPAPTVTVVAPAAPPPPPPAPAPQAAPQPPPPPAPPAAPKDVLSLKGNTARKTQPFTVTGAWQLEWNLKAGQYGVLSINVYDASGGLFDMAVLQMEPGPSSSYYPQGGTFYLDIDSANAPWEVKVIDLPDAAVAQPVTPAGGSDNYISCGDLKREGHVNIRRGHAKYRSELDWDGDGVACEDK